MWYLIDIPFRIIYVLFTCILFLIAQIIYFIIIIRFSKTMTYFLFGKPNAWRIEGNREMEWLPWDEFDYKSIFHWVIKKKNKKKENDRN